MDSLALYKFTESIINSRMDVVSKVDSFYNSAWTKLLIIVTISFAVIGLIVPIIIQYYQNQKIKDNETVLKAYIDEQLNHHLEKLNNEINKTIVERFNKINSDIDRQLASVNGAAWQLQASISYSEKKYALSLGETISAGIEYVKCEDFVNLKIVLDNIIQLLPYVTNDDLAELRDVKNHTIENLIENIENCGKNILLAETQQIKSLLRKKNVTP